MILPPAVVIELVVGAIVGAAIGLTGVGGGVLILPALTLLLDLPPTTAVGTASAYAFLSKIHAGIAHARLGTIEYRMAHRFLIGAVPGNLATALAIGWWKAQATDAVALTLLQARLSLAIEVLLVLATGLMVLNLLRPTAATDGSAPRRGHPVLGIGAGALIGAAIGATSIGGGVVLVPLLILCFGMTARATVGTSIYIALVLTLATALVCAGRGDVDWTVALILACGSCAGVWLGSRLAGVLPERPLQVVVVGLLAVAIAGMVLGQR